MLLWLQSKDFITTEQQLWNDSWLTNNVYGMQLSHNFVLVQLSHHKTENYVNENNYMVKYTP